MFHIFTVIAPLFLIIFASALLQRLKNLGEDWSHVLNEYALKIGLPVLVFSTLARAHFSFSEEIHLITANSLFILGSFLLAYLGSRLFRLSKSMRRTLFICLAFGNTAYLGIPILLQVSGETMLTTATLIAAIYLFWVFTVGIAYLDLTHVQKNQKVLRNIVMHLIKNPLLIAVFFGLLIGGFKVELPAILLKSLDMVSASVTPTVLIVIGLFIGKAKLGKLKDWVPVFFFTCIKLAILPAGFYFALKFLGQMPSNHFPTLIQAAMPLAITPFALADLYHLDKDFIARSIVMTTVLSILSLPFWVSIL